MAATQAAEAVTKVNTIVEQTVVPMETLISHLNNNSEFLKAVRVLLQGAPEDTPKLQPARDVLAAIDGMQVELRAAYDSLLNVLKKFRPGTEPEADEAFPKFLGGGTRRKRVKRRASTRGFYRKRRY